MSPATIPPAIAPRVGALVRMLGSDNDGEALNAARALGKALRSVGADFHALAEMVERPAEPVVMFRDPPARQRPKRPRKPRPSDIVLDATSRRRVGDALWRAMASGRLSEWETEFASSLAEQISDGNGRLSEKQGDALRRLLHRAGESAAWA